MKALIWLRRDLRLQDNKAIRAALKQFKSDQIIFFFNFDPHFLSKCPTDDHRITFIAQALSEIDQWLATKEIPFHIKLGSPIETLKEILKKEEITHLFFNQDFSPYARKRDRDVIRTFKEIECHHYQDHLLRAPDELVTGQGRPYTVFTPYKKKSLSLPLNTKKELVILKNAKLGKREPRSAELILESIGFTFNQLAACGTRKIALEKLKDFKKRVTEYHLTRDLLASKSTSELSPYLRFGQLGVREVYRELNLSKAEMPGELTFLSELIWRDFFYQVLYHYPQTLKNNFNSKYDDFPWRKSKADFKKWCEGKTGFPIVDASMRCLNQTGTMPNRMRMVVSSFLCKLLLIHWSEGEKYFGLKLNDFDPAMNTGNWQWAAGTGVDAAPYFRIFNPYNQSKKFDPNGDFIKKWLPELKELDPKQLHSANTDIDLSCKYPRPMVDYNSTRKRNLSLLKNHLNTKALS